MILGATPIGTAPIGGAWVITSVSEEGPVVVITVRRRIILM